MDSQIRVKLIESNHSVDCRGPKGKQVPKIFNAQLHSCGSILISGRLGSTGLENEVP